MKRFFAVAAATLWLGCGPSFAQTVTPGMGTTTPLGVPGTNSPAGPGGIPLGSTELTPGGISPGPLGSTANTSCLGVGSSIQTMSGTSVSGSTSTSTSTSGFDGGGLSSMQAGSSTSSGAMSGMSGMSGASATSSACGGTSPAGGTASGTMPSTPGSVAGSATGSGAIPLGSTELGNLGISPMTPMTTPGATATPCPTVGGSTITTPSYSTQPDGTVNLVTPGVTSLFGC